MSRPNRVGKRRKVTDASKHAISHHMHERAMLSERSATIVDGNENGEEIHLEWTTGSGETVVGVYQLLGWTVAPKKIKAQTEAELWVPKKTR